MSSLVARVLGKKALRDGQELATCVDRKMFMTLETLCAMVLYVSRKACSLGMDEMYSNRWGLAR